MAHSMQQVWELTELVEVIERWEVKAVHLIAKLFFLAGCAALIISASLKIWRMQRWHECDATSLGPYRTAASKMRIGQTKLAVSFVSHAGAPINTVLYVAIENGLPPPGTKVRIIYDPHNPIRADWPDNVIALALVIAASLAVILFALR